MLTANARAVLTFVISALAWHHRGMSPETREPGQASEQSAQARRTPRQVAREANLARIKELALGQLATEGAAGLSLRAIARELNLVSSAIYRYYASRDDLLTDLVIDAYRDLAAALTGAGPGDGRGQSGREAWVEVCLRLRDWALAQPHRYLLLYGSPVPGYRAPESTIEPASEVMRALVRPAWSASPALLSVPVPPRLADELAAVAATLGGAPGQREGVQQSLVSSTTMLRLAGAYAKVHGLVLLEVNGQFVGGFEPADLLFRAAVEDEADRLGLA